MIDGLRIFLALVVSVTMIVAILALVITLAPERPSKDGKTMPIAFTVEQSAWFDENCEVVVTEYYSSFGCRFAI